MSKNAIAARQNREKQKAYVKSLEDKVASLKERKQTLLQKDHFNQAKVEQLRNEVEYLNGVVGNMDQIKSIISVVANTPGVTSISTSLRSDMRTRPRRGNNENETSHSNG